MSKRSLDGEGCCAELGAKFQPGLFKALSDPNRIALLAKLATCRGGCTVTEAATCCAVDISVVSRHLRMLRDAGILHAVKKGKEVRYTVRVEVLAGALRAIADALSACCAGESCDCNEQGART